MPIKMASADVPSSRPATASCWPTSDVTTSLPAAARSPPCGRSTAWWCYTRTGHDGGGEGRADADGWRTREPARQQDRAGHPQAAAGAHPWVAEIDMTDGGGTVPGSPWTRGAASRCSLPRQRLRGRSRASRDRPPRRGHQGLLHARGLPAQGGAEARRRRGGLAPLSEAYQLKLQQTRRALSRSSARCARVCLKLEATCAARRRRAPPPRRPTSRSCAACARAGEWTGQRRQEGRGVGRWQGGGPAAQAPGEGGKTSAPSGRANGQQQQAQGRPAQAAGVRGAADRLGVERRPR